MGLKEMKFQNEFETMRMREEGYSHNAFRQFGLLRGEGGRRQLQSEGNNGDRNASRAPTSTDGTIAILVVVSILFCCVWLPGICRRRCINTHHHHQHGLSSRRQSRSSRDAAAVANVIRQSVDIQRRARGLPSLYTHPARLALSIERRRALLEDMLVTKHVIFDSTAATATTIVSSSADTSLTGDKMTAMMRSKSDLILPAVGGNNNNNVPLTNEDAIRDGSGGQDDSNATDGNDTMEPCAICLTDYQDGDEICWSQSPECPHVFHRACIFEWLLRHDECPCCRNDFLDFENHRGDEDARMMRMTSGSTASYSNATASVAPEADFVLALNAIHRQFPNGPPPALQAEIFRGLVDLYFPQVFIDGSNNNRTDRQQEEEEERVVQNGNGSRLVELTERLPQERIMLDAHEIMLVENDDIEVRNEEVDVEVGETETAPVVAPVEYIESTEGSGDDLVRIADTDIVVAQMTEISLDEDEGERQTNSAPRL